MNKFLRLGNIIINPAAIAKVELNAIGTKPCKHFITLMSQDTNELDGGSEQLIFVADSSEGKAIEEYFSSPDNVTNLLGASEEEQQYQWYLERGGDKSFSDWLGLSQRLEKLLEIEEPNQYQMQSIQKLEAELLS